MKSIRITDDAWSALMLLARMRGQRVSVVVTRMVARLGGIDELLQRTAAQRGERT